MKTKACDAKYPSAEAKGAAVVVDKRAFEAKREYLTRARKPDAELGTPAGRGRLSWSLIHTNKTGGLSSLLGLQQNVFRCLRHYAIIDLVTSMLMQERLSDSEYLRISFR